MRRAMFGVLALAFLAGLPLAFLGGPWLLLLGLVCLLFAYAYTGGLPRWLIMVLGDIFVFSFFWSCGDRGAHFFVQAGGFAGRGRRESALRGRFGRS